MRTHTWGTGASRGVIRAVIATFFALALVLAMSAPAAMAQDTNDDDWTEAGAGFYLGFLDDADHEDQWIDATVLPAGESLEDFFEELERWFEEEEAPSDEEFAQALTFTFFLEETDDYSVNGDDTDKHEFLCAAILTIEEDAGHIFGAAYQPEEEEDSEFWLFTDSEEDNGWCPEEPEEEEPEHPEAPREEPQPVERAERVETGAGGTAGGGAGVLALLFGLIAAAGATVLRKGSATS
jgi:hypothetical protein